MKKNEKFNAELQKDVCGSKYYVKQCKILSLNNLEKKENSNEDVDMVDNEVNNNEVNDNEVNNNKVNDIANDNIANNNIANDNIANDNIANDNIIDENIITERMKNWKNYFLKQNNNKETNKSKILKSFIASQLSDLYSMSQAKEKIYWLFNRCKGLNQNLKYKSEKVSLVQHRFNLGYKIDLTKLQIHFYHFSGDREFYCAYLPDQRYVKFQIISYQSPVPCGPTCKAHTFQVDRTGKVIYSCSVEEEAEYMYKRFILMIHEIKKYINGTYNGSDTEKEEMSISSEDIQICIDDY